MLDLSYAIRHDAVVRHECGHAAAFLALGILPKSLDVSGRSEFRGVVTVADDWRVITNNRDAMKEGVNVICALACEGAPLPVWPLDSDAVTSTDLRNLAGLAKTFGWTEEMYEGILAGAKSLMASEGFIRAYNALGALCQRKMFITADEMRPLLATSAKPRAERRGFQTTWLQTKSLRRGDDDAGARALARVDEIMAHYQDWEAAQVAREFGQ